MRKVLFLADKVFPQGTTGATAYQIGVIRAILGIKDVELTLVSTLHPRANLIRFTRDEAYPEYREAFTKILDQVDETFLFPEDDVRGGLSKRLNALRILNSYTKQDHFDVVHVSHPKVLGLEALCLNNYYFSGRKSWIIKHIFTPIITPIKAVLASLVRRGASRLKRNLLWAFSSEFVAKTHFAPPYPIIPPAVDTEIYKPSDLPIESSGCFVPWEDQKVILYMGPTLSSRFPYKQILPAIRLLRSHFGHEVSIVVVSAPWRLELESDGIRKFHSYAGRLGLGKNVKVIVKVLTPSEKVMLFNQCDVVIQLFGDPLLFIPIDPPMTLLEAMACGKTVVTTKGFSIPEIIKHGYSGFCVEHLDEYVLANVIDQAIDSCSRIGKEARQTVIENFSIERVSSIVKDVYERIL